MEVIDNFLPSYYFNQLQSTLESGTFPWYYNPGINMEYEKEHYQFTHVFFDEKSPWNGVASEYYDMWEYCFQKLGVKKLVRLKANLRPRTTFPRRSGYHIDYEDVTTAILYMNTNNGWTTFKKGGRVKSVANRIVVFDSNLLHSGVSCTNEKIRMVVNFNYV